MVKYRKLFLLFFSFIISNEQIIPYAVYNFVASNKKFLNIKNINLEISSTESSYFQIMPNLSSQYYLIRDVKSSLKLSSIHGNIELVSGDNLDTIEWNFIQLEDNTYVINNKNQCYIALRGSTIKCENKIEDAMKFNLKKIYEGLNHTKEDLELIEKEPIDVVIKYIDLRDSTLVREGIPQIKKDVDNEELKYNIRSILKNIPWVRKIFIVMPNNKVRYFKDYDLIKEKIVYVKDKDLLGFDSSNSCTFHFNYWKLERFNISENFILMDDDYFIGKPLKKSDFFYVENGKVIPAIIARDFTNYTIDSVEKKYQYYSKRITGKQNHADYDYSVLKGYLYILKKYNKYLIIPSFSHNATPCNIKEVKELYNIVFNSEYKYSTLDSIYRHVETLQFQSFYIAYFFVKNNKKVNYIPFRYIEIKDVFKDDYNISLFVINTGSGFYSDLSFKKTKLAMEYNFPEPTPYEKINYNILPNLAFNTITEILKNEKKLYVKFYIIIFMIIIIFMFVQMIIICFFCKFIKGKVLNKSIREEIEI